MMIREMTDDERQRAKEKQRMNTRNMADEINLYNAMVKYKLTVKEAIQAMSMYANDKEFQEHLDAHYENGLLVDDAEDMVTPDY
tara:strand:- start:244 stop:495 length:252 start_codon:yes stop_codon:yes gene_type:complete